MSDVLVYKFGGTSLDGADRIERALQLAQEATERGSGVVLVASAMGATTDTLHELATAAPDAGAGDAATIRRLIERHQAVARQLCSGAVLSACLAAIDAVGVELGEQVAALRPWRSSPAATTAAILSTGERLSTRVIAAAAAERGFAATLVDARQLIRTNGDHLEATVDRPATAQLLSAGARPSAGELVVMQGFLGATADGTTTTLGRGGSDYTATLVGAALAATEVVIWTDVDAVMTCDPKVVPDARPLAQLSYRVAAELAYCGAAVLHPQTIGPAVEAGTPVRVRNPHLGSGPGTIIHAGGDHRGPAAIAFKQGITVVNVTSSRMLDNYGFLRRIFATFEAHRTSVDLVTTSEVSVSMTIDDESALPAIVADLEQIGTVTVEQRQAIVSMVGDGLLEADDVLANAATAINGTPVTLLSLGASDVNLSLVVPDAASNHTVRALHHALLDMQPQLKKETFR